MRNNRDGTFRDVTKQSGLDQNNTRFSFCLPGAITTATMWPDLYVVNDFGRKNLYRNNGDGTFTDVAREAGVEDVGAGMSGCWLDFDNDGRQDLYVADMWTAAGIRISQQENFRNSDEQADSRALSKARHGQFPVSETSGDGRFADARRAQGRRWAAGRGRAKHGTSITTVFRTFISPTAWFPASMREDLNSFFWRQVVANSPQRAEAKP